ncbi:MAG: helix-turn-helix domain-containing protein [Blastocatellia bacterium]
MGKSSRSKPRRLAEKLLQVRRALALSQDDMVRSLGLIGEIDRNYVSKFERGTHEPNLLVLLQYARVAGVCVDILIDDQQDLPNSLPTTPVHGRSTKRK